MNIPFLAIVAVNPLFRPLEPNPFSLTICLVTDHVLGTWVANDLLDCNVTFTTSKGLTKIASVIPAPKPARENVWNYKYCKIIETSNGLNVLK